MTYEVQKVSHMEYLKYYETEVYKVKGCNIKLVNGKEGPWRLSFTMGIGIR